MLSISTFSNIICVEKDPHTMKKCSPVEVSWLINFKSMSTSIGLFYTYRLGNRVYYTFIFIFFVPWFLKSFFLQTVI